MASPAFAAFVRDAERLTHDPHAIADRLRELLAVDGWLEPRHQLPGRDTYRQHLLHVSRSEEHTSELQSRGHLVCRLLLEKKKTTAQMQSHGHIVCRHLLQKKKKNKN